MEDEYVADGTVVAVLVLLVATFARTADRVRSGRRRRLIVVREFGSVFIGQTHESRQKLPPVQLASDGGMGGPGRNGVG